MSLTISRRSRISPFLVMDVMEDARLLEEQGRDIVHMEVGQPGTPAPATAVAAVTEALQRRDPLGYTVALGRPELRRAIADLYRTRHGIDLDPRRVIVTTGSSCGFILAFLALFDAGGRVALADPGYPAYRNILGALDLEPVRIVTDLSTGYQPTSVQIAEAGQVDGVLVASPANPTGTMLDRAALTDLADFCDDRGAVLISDEIYHGLSYGAREVTALEITDDAIVINSFAKYFSMTGWRIGWMVVPDALVRTIENLAQNLFICTPHVSQIAALGALDASEELEGHRNVYAANRALLLEELPKIGFRDLAPADGAFYIYADISEFSHDSQAFSRLLLNEAGVAATTGIDFDPDRGHHTMRFSFARTQAEISLGVERLRTFLAKG